MNIKKNKSVHVNKFKYYLKVENYYYRMFKTQCNLINKKIIMTVYDCVVNAV